VKPKQEHTMGQSIGYEVRDPVTGQQWEVVEKTLPGGFRMVATVDRPNGDIYDLGQNAEGKFALFRRLTDPFSFYSHGKAERLSDIDVAGFGLLRAVCFEPPEGIEEQGEYSSLCTSHLIHTGA
jgi:hypothetical protein